jgi:glycosyltransferase involved in cell wall biosynthesis
MLRLDHRTALLALVVLACCLVIIAPVAAATAASAPNATRVLVEGWRHYLHSYAIVNAFQLAALYPFTTQAAAAADAAADATTRVRTEASARRNDATAQCEPADDDHVADEPRRRPPCVLRLHVYDMPPYLAHWPRHPTSVLLDSARYLDRVVALPTLATLLASASNDTAVASNAAAITAKAKSKAPSGSGSPVDGKPSASLLSSASWRPPASHYYEFVQPSLPPPATVYANGLPSHSLVESPPTDDPWDSLDDVHGGRKGESVKQTVPLELRWRFDAIFRASYPINIELPAAPTSSSSSSLSSASASDPAPPVLFVFYTAETRSLRREYFVGGTPADFVARCRSRRIIALTPSHWSARSLRAHGVQPVVLPHGVDTSVFRPQRDRSHAHWLSLVPGFPAEVLDDAQGIKFLSVGAMTHNKNVRGILAAFFAIANEHAHVYLLLKCQSGLYHAGQRIDKELQDMQRDNGGRAPYADASVAARVLLIESDLSARGMAALYNMADAYLSPYHAEAFNMPVLEAIASGLPVCVWVIEMGVG